MNRPNTSMASGVPMLVRHSLWRMGVISSIAYVFFLSTAIAMYWFFFDAMGSPFPNVDMMQALLDTDPVPLVCTIWLLALVIPFLFPNGIRGTEHDITGPPIGGLFYTVKVSASSVDVRRSSHRPVIFKLLGQYRIYNQDGTGIQVNKYIFSRADFKKLKERVNDVLGVDLDQT